MRRGGERAAKLMVAAVDEGRLRKNVCDHIPSWSVKNSFILGVKYTRLFPPSEM